MLQVTEVKQITQLARALLELVTASLKGRPPARSNVECLIGYLIRRRTENNVFVAKY